MAAGLGTRLRPLTNDMPKAMIPIAEGKPLLEHTISFLRNQGVDRFIINLHYLPKKIVDYFGDGGKFGVNITYSDESDCLLETAGAFKKAEDLLDDDFIVNYGDMLHFVDFSPAINLHLKNKAMLTMILKKSISPQSADMAEINLENNKVMNWIFRPHNITDCGDRYFSNSGLYVVSKKILDYIPAGKPVRLETEVLPLLIKNNAGFYGITVSDPVVDIGTPEKYKSGKELYGNRIKE